jgi:dihydrodipicolinate synthase/N-acetylneuraminate lyase
MRFRSDPASIRGSIAPVVSPFTADGLPDLESLRGLVRWQLESGSHGISLGGSTGEPSAPVAREFPDLPMIAYNVPSRTAVDIAPETVAPLGGVGFVSATANLAPAATARMYELGMSGEFDRARDLHFALHPVTDVIFTETNPAAAKWVLAQAGLIKSGYVRPPLIPLTEAGRATALALLKQGAPALEGPVAKVAL